MNRRVGLFVDQNIHIRHHLREFCASRAFGIHLIYDTVGSVALFVSAIDPVKGLDALARIVDTLIIRTTATEFTAKRSPAMHLTDFDREQFYRKLWKLRERKRSGASRRAYDSHGELITRQSESRLTASVIDQRFSVA